MPLKKDGATIRHLAAKENNLIIKQQMQGRLRGEEETIKTGKAIEAMSKCTGWIMVLEWINKTWDFNQMFASYTAENNKDGFDVKMKELSGINKLKDHIDMKIANGVAAQKRVDEYNKQPKDQ